MLANYAKENPGKTAAIISTLIGAGAFAKWEYKLIRDLLKDPAENFKDWLQRTEDHKEVRPTGYKPIICLDDPFSDQEDEDYDWEDDDC